VLHVLLARARELDRTPDRLRHLHRLQRVVRDDLAAEAPAQKRDVDLDVVGGAAGRVRDHLLTRRDRLDRPPDLDLTVLVAGGRIDRLERRVGNVRQQEPPLDHRCRALFQDFLRLAFQQRSHPMLGVQGRVELRVDAGAGEIARDATVERHVEGIDGPFGLPEMIGDDSDRVVPRQVRRLRMLRAGVLVDDRKRRELHHRTHPRHLENVGFVLDGRHLPGEGARGLDGGVEHARHHDVDAEHRAAVAFRRRVQARHRLADQVKPAAFLERRRRVERQLGRAGGKLPIRELLAAAVDDVAALGPALRKIDTPSLGRRAHEHVAGSSAGGAQARVEHRGRHRGALFLHGRLLAERDLVGRSAGHEPDLDAGPVGVELVRQDLRQHGVRALPDLRLGEPERDLAVRRNHDPVGDLIVRLVAPLGAGRPRGDGNEQGCAGQRRSGEDETARHGRHHNLRCPAPRPPAMISRPWNLEPFQRRGVKATACGELYRDA
jgi:hypothetical protein